MSYREVTMLEIKEVLRLWCGGSGKKRIATHLGLDIKTVRRYVRAAQACGPWPAGEAALDEAPAAAVGAAVHPGWGRPRGKRWTTRGPWPAGEAALDEAQVAAVVAALQPDWGRPRGKLWTTCEREREFISSHLKHDVRLTKIRKLLRRRGVEVSYPTLRRFAVAELDF